MVVSLSPPPGVRRQSRPPGGAHGPGRHYGPSQWRPAVEPVAGRATSPGSRRVAHFRGLLATDPERSLRMAHPALSQFWKTKVARPAEQIWPGPAEDPTGRGTVTCVP